MAIIGNINPTFSVTNPITRGYIPLNPIKLPFSYGFPMVSPENPYGFPSCKTSPGAPCAAPEALPRPAGAGRWPRRRHLAAAADALGPRRDGGAGDGGDGGGELQGGGDGDGIQGPKVS